MNKLLLLAAMLFALANACFSQLEELEQSSGILTGSRYLAQINEVYPEDFFVQNQNLKEQLVELLEKRVSLEENDFTGKNFPLLSSLPLMNRYNPAIVPFSPEQFDASVFNPLWYSFNFFDKTDQFFIVDGTNYVLFIQHYNAD